MWVPGLLRANLGAAALEVYMVLCWFLVGVLGLVKGRLRVVFKWA